MAFFVEGESRQYARKRDSACDTLRQELEGVRATATIRDVVDVWALDVPNRPAGVSCRLGSVRIQWFRVRI